ncbi:FHAD1 protein, partial [Nothoprocta ornata]|nr:FHAD1 protein [Nothoprocta pentlandii]NWY00484.1 FHAD1 protein [Nothoprocta ornata]
VRAFLRGAEGCFPLRSPTTTIGRNRDADIVLQSAGVEERHAALDCAAAGFVLRDLASSRGTLVNGCHVHGAAVGVGPGDVLRFGPRGPGYELVLLEDGAAPV